MGISLCLDGYKKANEGVVAKISSLNLYEISMDDIHPFKIAGTEGCVHTHFESIHWILKAEDEYHFGYGFDHIRALKLFYNNIPDAMDGWGFHYDPETNKHLSLAFDAADVLEIVKKVLSIFDNFSKVLQSPEEEKSELSTLQSFLEKIAEQDGIVFLRYA